MQFSVVLTELFNGNTGEVFMIDYENTLLYLKHLTKIIKISFNYISIFKEIGDSYACLLNVLFLTNYKCKQLEIILYSEYLHYYLPLNIKEQTIFLNKEGEQYFENYI